MSVEEQTRDALLHLERHGELVLDDEEMEHIRIVRDDHTYTIVITSYFDGALDLTDEPITLEEVPLEDVETTVRSFYRTLEQLMSL